MNFKAEIDQLTINPDLFSIDKDPYMVLKIPTQIKGKLIHNFYALNSSELLGQGAFGCVFKSYPLNKEGILDETKPRAIKILQRTSYRETESATFSHYYALYGKLVTPDRVYLVTEFIPGIELFTKEQTLAPELAHLTLAERLNIVKQICFTVNSLQHKTPRTGGALIHADIKGENIKIDIREVLVGRNEAGEPITKKVIGVYLLDFGFAQEIEENTELLISLDRGTPIYLPDETIVEKKRGLKSDIYALIPIIATVLGGMPLEARLCVSTIPELAGIRFDHTFLLHDLDKDLDKNVRVKLKSFLINFLDRMESILFMRPDSDQLLKFFINLENFHNYSVKLSQGDFLPAQREIYQEKVIQAEATLALLSRGLWLAEFYKQDPTTNRAFCTKIITLDRNRILNRAVLGIALRELEKAIEDETKSYGTFKM